MIAHDCSIETIRERSSRGLLYYMESTVTRIDHDRARGSINYNVYQRGKVGFGVWSCITRSGKGDVEKTGRADETGSPGCACSGAREQESGKSGMQASSRPWRFASRGNNSPRNPGEEASPCPSLGEIWMSCFELSRFHDRDNFLRSRVIILVDRKIAGYWKHEARTLQAWEKIKIKNSR